MTKKFADLKARMPEDAQARVNARVKDTLHEMALSELRQARGLSQKTLAEKLKVQQPSIAKLESRTDMYISTLREHIRALGGELDIVARFPEGNISIKTFKAL